MRAALWKRFPRHMWASTRVLPLTCVPWMALAENQPVRWTPRRSTVGPFPSGMLCKIAGANGVLLPTDHARRSGLEQIGALSEQNAFQGDRWYSFSYFQ